MLMDDIVKNIPPGGLYRKKAPVTEDTVGAIIALIKQSKAVPLVRETAEDIVAGVAEKDWVGEVNAVFNYVKNNLRYTRDFSDTEYIKTPDKHLRDIRLRGQSFGDCDDHTTLAGALLYSIGFKTRVVIIQSLWNRSGGFNHVYLHANIPFTGNWIAVDATAKDQPFGYEPKYLNIKTFEVTP